MSDLDLVPFAYPIERAAKLAGCSSKHLRRQIAAGKLMARKLGSSFNSPMLIERPEMLRWLASLPTTSTDSVAA